MSRKRVALVAVVWAVMWMVTWSGSLAFWQERHPLLMCQDYRTDLGRSMFLALLPPSWLMIPFFTGFYEHGFQIKPREGCR